MWFKTFSISVMPGELSKTMGIYNIFIGQAHDMFSTKFNSKYNVILGLIFSNAQKTEEKKSFLSTNKKYWWKKIS